MTTAPAHPDPGLPGDIEIFLEECGLQGIASNPLPLVAEVVFPLRDRLAEHGALTTLVLRLLAVSRVVASHTCRLERLDEQDLVRGQFSPDFLAWWKDYGHATLVRLALLDCRERLSRLVILDEEAKRMQVFERLSAPILRDEPGELGALQALAVWLLSERRAISSRVDQVKELRTELLPQPAWRRHLEIRDISPRLSLFIEQCDALFEDSLLFWHASLAKHQELDSKLGDLARYEICLDIALWDVGPALPPESLKYERVRKVIGEALVCLNADQKEAIAASFPSMDSLEDAIELADRLTDRESGIWDLMGTEIFRPDDWKLNRDSLRPLLVDRKQHIRHDIRSQVMDVTHAFVLGQWAAVSALSRALLERAVKLNWSRLNGQRPFSDEFPSLNAMINDLAKEYPMLDGDMDLVRRYGNRVLHGDLGPKVNDPATRMANMRRDALESIEALFRVLEGLPRLAR